MSIKHLFRTFILALSLVSIALPAVSKSHKLTPEERAQAVMRIYDLLQSGQWVMVIENIQTTSWGYSNLMPERNYLYIQDSLLVKQIDTTGAHGTSNLNIYQRQDIKRRIDARPDLYAARRPVRKEFENVLSTEIRTNRSGTKVVYTLFVNSPDFPQKTRMRMIIDPVTLSANMGIYTGHLVPSNETLMYIPDPYLTPEQQRTIDKQRRALPNK